MPRGRKHGRPSSNGAKPAKARGARGRKPIFTPAQKKVLNRMIRSELRTELKVLVKAL